MTGMVYLMRSLEDSERVKFGHRTKSSLREVIDEVNSEYGVEYRCFAVYDLGTDTQEETEKTASQIRLIIRAVAGALAEERPEYYELCPEKALTILKAVAVLRGDSEETVYEVQQREQDAVTWYIENNGEAKLIPEEVLKYKIENEEVSGDTLVVNEEIGNWVPLKETQIWKQIHPDVFVAGKTDAFSEANIPVQETHRKVGVKVKDLAKFLVLFAAGMTIVLLLTIFVGEHKSASKLNGTYVAYFDLADNAITFTRDGKYVREARTFGDWGEVSRGTYKLQGTEIVLSSSDGKSWVFYYDKASDTLQQQGVTGVFSKIR